MDRNEKGRFVQGNRGPAALRTGVYNESRQRYKEKTRRRVFSHYGLACCCCGESDIRALVIDHISGDGAQKRRDKVHPTGGVDLYRWLIKNSFPAGFRTLCHSCNSIAYWNNNVLPVYRMGVNARGAVYYS